jgi:Protein of unknown function, DUF547
LRFLLLLSFAFAAPAQGFDHAHQSWDALLRKHVVVLDGGKASQLRYVGIAQERAALKQYLDTLSKVSETDFNAWSKPEQMAFLINAYNAYTVEKILTRYPNIRSIWDFGKFFGNPFRDEFFTLLGRKFSLDRIEHETLRPRYKEPRVHYAVNCASVGCPMLREEAYIAVRLDEQLEAQANRFLSDRSRNRARDGRLEVSKIFDWFKEDFEPRNRYFSRYAAVLADNAQDHDKIVAGVLPLSFLDYDWSLNDSRSSSPR